MTLIALLLQAAAVDAPPADWSNLPQLSYVRPPDEGLDLAAYVRSEVAAGRCAQARPSPMGVALTVDLVVLVAPNGMPRRILPRAIDCPSVEQYAAGVISARARGNVAMGEATAQTWYRTSLTFEWPA